MYPTVAISTPRAGTYVYVLLTEVVDKHREHAERICADTYGYVLLTEVVDKHREHAERIPVYPTVAISTHMGMCCLLK